MKGSLDTDRHARGVKALWRGASCYHQPRSCQELGEACRDPSLSPQRGRGPAHFDLGLPASRTGRQYISGVEATPSVVLQLWQPYKQMLGAGKKTVEKAREQNKTSRRTRRHHYWLVGHCRKTLTALLKFKLHTSQATQRSGLRNQNVPAHAKHLQP